MQKSSIILKNLTLDFPVHQVDSTSFRSHLAYLASAGRLKKECNTHIIRGLNNISLELHPGDRLALIGGNGAGKTTLLKTLARIYTPTSGSIHIQGSISCLLGTGFGMDEPSTGYENIIMGGVTLGYPLKQIKKSIKEIEEFTELGHFLNMPLRTYSAGMRARLAFAIATCIEPEILLIDENIGVGDAQFFKKAQSRLHSILNNAKILVFASHTPELLSQFCNKAIFMQSGSLIYEGSIEEAQSRYMQQALHLTPQGCTP